MMGVEVEPNWASSSLVVIWPAVKLEHGLFSPIRLFAHLVLYPLVSSSKVDADIEPFSAPNVVLFSS